MDRYAVKHSTHVLCQAQIIYKYSAYFRSKRSGESMWESEFYLVCGLGRRGGGSEGSSLLLGGDDLSLLVNGKDLLVGMGSNALDSLGNGVLLNLLNLVLDLVLGVNLGGLGGDGLGNLVLIIELLDSLLELSEVSLDLVAKVVFLVILEALGDDMVLKLVAGGKVLSNDPRLGLALLAVVGGLLADRDGILEVRLDGDVRIVDKGVCEERGSLGSGLAFKPNEGSLLAAILVLLKLEILNLAAEEEKVLDGLLRGSG